MNSLLPLPPPYKAWLTISSDPDHTEESDWRELHNVIWGELGLPIADAVFLRNANSTLPDQVSAQTHPDILTAHPIDTIHTWGDYILANTEVFDRGWAEEGVDQLKRAGLVPRVWVDHSFFHGNFVLPPCLGAKPYIQDASGNRYANQFYTLDLAYEAGVRYVWDGTVRRAMARPDRPVSRGAYYSARNGNEMMGHLLGAADWLGRPFWRWLAAQKFDYNSDKTRIYYPVKFPDGRSLYAFWRYGTWDLADICGLGELIHSHELDRMTRMGASCILYSHLGKRKVTNVGDGQHIPDATRKALEEVRKRYVAQELMVSSVSQLLDYCVLRDHAVVTHDRIDFRSDGIRFEKLAPSDLVDHRFGLDATSISQIDRLEVCCDGVPIEFSIQEEARDTLTIEFAPRHAVPNQVDSVTTCAS